ncbi:MAG: multifunctional oxoglutarate decarboxylase/oxoglutarate dehydrogenase thiamine pyrophosphate-binding subunit/dihydrolipoyllysine-residue succinyltransferase subunit [Gemmatimonadetes bacterium]|nr:multifunctional oxoglutarate decarboxylase/oxoglutarate dehydrogenase thiamine pyrophosphate-binding subunit/dihydrolipoyllysine-residue succinyltransferase subunit [Gemmatimonadota bacterium]
MFENIFETVNSGFAQALYEDFLRDPASVPAEWRALFENGLKGETPTANGAGEAAGAVGAEGPATSTVRPATAPTRGQPAPRFAPGAISAAPPASSPPALPAGTLTPIAGPALRLLHNMESSLAVPTATSFREVEVGRLWEVRSLLNQSIPKDHKLSFTHIMGWAIVRAAEKFPMMYHAVFEVDGTAQRLDPGAVNLGLAVDVERKDGTRGLMVPVIRRAHQLSFAQFHAQYERLVLGARDGELGPDAYTGATITLTNPGTLGTSASVPRLMKGQGSIIATGMIREVAGDRVMTITSTYDHRIIQGAESGSFLRLVDQLVQGEQQFYEEIAESFGLSPETVAEEVGRKKPPGAALQPSAGAALSVVPAESAAPADLLFHVAAAVSLVKSFRTHGHHAAKLDPLGTEPPGDPALDPAPLGLTREVMAAIPAEVLRIHVPGRTLAEALPILRETYCGTIAYEIEHISNHQERVWLRRVIESGEHRKALRAEEKRRVLEMLTRVDALERFLHRTYLGHKRFGIEGVDAVVPMLIETLDESIAQGIREAVMGMAHRGRLNVLTHILGLPYETLLAEFEGGRRVEETLTPKGGTGDVKYHHGAAGTYTSPAGASLPVTLMPNPSHLEAVDPVVEGRARASQTRRNQRSATWDADAALAILIHGDAAFAAQGVVAETFNLARVNGYGTGGTLHLILNNQVGFTTDPKEARSTDYASDLAKGFDVPIVHVNADDPEACLSAIRLAMLYRREFGGDFVIDLVGYRRYGHNEGDEPRYTQPVMYQHIDSHLPVRDLYADRLIKEGAITAEDASRMADDRYRELTEIQQKLRKGLTGADPGEEPDRISHSWRPPVEPATAVPEPALRELTTLLLTVPEGFNVNPKLKRQLDRRLEVFGGGAALDWSHAEQLAFASLLVEGVPLRLSGQDSVRGTFSQRQLTLHDANTGQQYTPIQNIPGAKAAFELYNSPLSEYAVLGFEYGYSVAAADTMVMWEAQFGDFANGAEVIIDQFIIAGLAKWGQTSRLVLLLPHGYEGQGPEHSSARLERYLALSAEGNIRVANCSTPAQYFHLLRRQAKHAEVRPMVLLTPKSLLRLPLATSALREFSDGRFLPVLDDPTRKAARDHVTKLVFCSGKVFYDVISNPRRNKAAHVAVARIELLYPFPLGEVVDLMRLYPHASEIVWLQEEPSNFGARKWVVPQLEQAAPKGVLVRWVSRPERSSPAEGYPAAHQAEQERLVAETLA